MKSPLRFFLALTLMIGVFVVTDILFPPVQPEGPEADPDAAEVVIEPVTVADPALPGEEPIDPLALLESDREEQTEDSTEAAGTVQDATERPVTVETPLYRMTFSPQGGVAQSVRLLGYESFAREGPVELVPEGDAILGGLWVAGSGGEAFDLTAYPHAASPPNGIALQEGDSPQTLTFRYDHPGGRFFSEIRYTFDADSYMVRVEGSLPAIDRAALFVDLGSGVAFNELREENERRMMALSGNQVDEGIRSVPLQRIDEPEIIAGPLRWAAVKSKYFVEVILPPEPGAGTVGGGQLAALRAIPGSAGLGVEIAVGTPVSDAGTYAYRAYLGPIERQRLVAIGDDLEEVNPYGWAIFRPIVRPFVGVVLWLVRFLHESLFLGYGWVLIVIGVLLRLVMWPLNRKMMMSQVKTMAVQPLAEEIKRKFANDAQKMQQETLKLYREHGINPMSGCLPMMIPMPVLIALFFVFQNTIEMRGVPFMWLPDLSAPDPFYILPIAMAGSLFFSQWITMRISGGGNPQMKMMMYIMPAMFLIFFWNFPSGLNLYYATMNLASIPQTILIGKERKRMQAAQPMHRPA